MKRIGGVLVLFLLVCTSGCSYYDNKAFEEAKASNTEESYSSYLSQYPSGVRYDEAKKLFKEMLVANGLARFNIHKDVAANYESSGDWQSALRMWELASQEVSENEAIDDLRLSTRREEADQRAKLCTIVIDNPVTVSDETVAHSYYYRTIPGTHITGASIKGKITNNCPFQLSSVVLRLQLVQERSHTINTATGEDGISGDYHVLAQIERTVCVGRYLSQGESYRFSFKGKVSANTTISNSLGGDDFALYYPDPKYIISIVSYTAR